MEQEEGVNIMRGCVPLALKPLEDDTSLGEHSPLLVQYKCLDDQLVGSDTWNTVIFATGIISLVYSGTSLFWTPLGPLPLKVS